MHDSRRRMIRQGRNAIAIAVGIGVITIGLIGPRPVEAKSGKKKAPQQTDAPPPDQPDPTSKPAVDNTALRKAQQDLQAAKSAAKTKYESSADWTAAATELKAAQADSDTSVVPVLTTLKQSDSYKAANAELTAAEDKISTLRESGAADDASISAAASDAMTDRSKLRSMEKQAVDADPAASAAKSRLTTAMAAMDKVRMGEASAIAADPGVLVAQQAVDAAKTAAASSGGSSTPPPDSSSGSTPPAGGGGPGGGGGGTPPGGGGGSDNN